MKKNIKDNNIKISTKKTPINKNSKQEEKVVENNLEERKKIYFSYHQRLLFSTLLCLLFLILSITYVYHSLDIAKEESITYSEKGSVDYKICLKENNFYENSCLDKNMSYVASLIKNISLVFNYNFSSNKDLDLTSKYEVVANLVISNNENSTNYYNKKYILLPITTIKKNNSNYAIVNKDIDIDYEYYNTIASKFKSQYGVETSSVLNVSFIVYNESTDLNLSPSITTISIPLSQKSININMQSTDTVNNNKQELTKYVFALSNAFYLCLGVICTVLAIVFAIKTIRLFTKSFPKKNNYDKYLGKILKEYDRLIVETAYLPKFNDYNIIKINKFSELLDVRDNLKLPIMYYNVVTHQKCHLYILKDNNLYLLTLKDIDL